MSVFFVFHLSRKRANFQFGSSDLELYFGYESQCGGVRVFDGHEWSHLYTCDQNISIVIRVDIYDNIDAVCKAKSEVTPETTSWPSVASISIVVSVVPLLSFENKVVIPIR